MAPTSKIRYENPELQKKHEEQTQAQKTTKQQPGSGETGGRELGNEHDTQAENATEESGLADDQPK